MSRFFKFLILIAAVINLVFVFIFEGKIPSDLPIPFINHAAESDEKAVEEAEALPAETEVTEGAEAKIQTEETTVEEEDRGVETEEPEEPVEEILPRCRITAQGGSNIRSGPGTGFEIVTVYPYDTVLILTGEPEIGWHPILAEDGTEGYIFENQIEILDVNAAEEDALQMEGLLQ